MLQNTNSEYVYWKLKFSFQHFRYANRTLIAIELASCHFVMDTISNSLLSHLVLSLLHALNFFHYESFQEINNYSILHKYYRRLSNYYRRGMSGDYQRIKLREDGNSWTNYIGQTTYQ